MSRPASNDHRRDIPTPSMNSQPPSTGESSREIDLIGIYYTLRGQAWIVLACAAAALLIAGIYLWWTPKVYEGQAVIQVDQSERKVVKIDDINNENFESIESLKTLEQNLSNWTLLQRVVQPEAALVAEPHHDDRGDGLADRAQAVLHVGVRLGHRAPAGRPDQPAVPHHARDQARRPSVALCAGDAGEEPAGGGRQDGFGHDWGR